jgi:hypothetical protein
MLKFLSEFITFNTGLIARFRLAQFDQPFGRTGRIEGTEAKMKSWFWKGMMAAAIILPALSGAAWAGGDDD